MERGRAGWSSFTEWSGVPFVVFVYPLWSRWGVRWLTATFVPNANLRRFMKTIKAAGDRQIIYYLLSHASDSIHNILLYHVLPC